MVFEQENSGVGSTKEKTPEKETSLKLQALTHDPKLRGKLKIVREDTPRNILGGVPPKAEVGDIYIPRDINLKTELGGPKTGVDLFWATKEGLVKSDIGNFPMTFEEFEKYIHNKLDSVNIN